MKKWICFWVFAVSACTLVADPPPNVVLILSDDQGYADYSFMGHEMIQTPRIDQLASQSLVYERGYVTTAVCCPSLSTMLTGLYPHQHRTTGNDPVLRGTTRTPRTPWINRFREMPQLPRLMAEHGYLTLCTGKYWHGNPEVSGFTDSMGATLRHGSPYSLSIGRETMQPIWEFIQTALDQEKPFMVWYAPEMPEQKVELFEIQKDPLEKNNLAEQHPEKVNELQKKLDTWWNPIPQSSGDTDLNGVNE